MKHKINKWLKVLIVQGNYGMGWEDESEYSADNTIERIQAKLDLKEYRTSSAGAHDASYRLITRRVLNPDCFSNLPVEMKIKNGHYIGGPF